MNADCTYQIGHDHTVCEDYAIAGNLADRITYAIVCDGCSASPDVDFGARVLAKAAEDVIYFHGNDKTIDATLMGTMVIQKAARIFEILPTLHPQALDATLLYAYVKDRELQVGMFGDGVFVHRGKAGISTVHIQLSSGAPDYLSYALDKRRKASYNLMADNKKEIVVKSASEALKFPTECKPLEPYTFRMPVEDGDVIAVISDGINSFRQSNNQEIDWASLVEEFTGFKTFEGQFVQRRIKAFKRKCSKDVWQHLDDISIAAIVI